MKTSSQKKNILPYNKVTTNEWCITNKSTNSFYNSLYNNRNHYVIPRVIIHEF